MSDRPFDESDSAINTNHAQGLYYTRQHTKHAHAFYLNQAPGIYLVKATKVFNRAASSVFTATGPTAGEFFRWNKSKSQWQPANLDPGFDGSSAQLGAAKKELIKLAKTDPLAVERIVNLSAGRVHSEDWHAITEMTTCILKQDELVHRVTYCQDQHPDCVRSRHDIYSQVSELKSIVSKKKYLPAAMKDVATGGKFSWEAAFPDQNLISSGKRGTAIYLGENPLTSDIGGITLRLRERLRRSISDQKLQRAARQRLGLPRVQLTLEV